MTSRMHIEKRGVSHLGHLVLKSFFLRITLFLTESLFKCRPVRYSDGFAQIKVKPFDMEKSVVNVQWDLKN